MISPIHTILIQSGQSLADIAIQEYGTVEGMVLILQANPGLSVSDELIPGAELIIPGTTIEKTQATATQAAPEPATAIQQIPIIEAPVKSVSNYQAVKTITVQAGQSLADIALQEYGTFEGVILILQANPGLSIADQLAGGQELNLFTGYTVNLVKELVKVEPYASQLQSLLAQWAALIKFPASGITEESDPVFMEWLATFEPFSGSYNDLSDKPNIPAQLVPQDGILDWDGTKYEPYTTRQAGGKFERNTGIPTHYDALTYDGEFFAKGFATFGGSYGGGFMGNTSEGNFGSGGFSIASYNQYTKVLFDVMLGSYARLFAYGKRDGVPVNDSTLPIFIGCKTNWSTGINKNDEWICIDDYAKLFEINMTNIKLTKGTANKYLKLGATNLIEYVDATAIVDLQEWELLNEKKTGYGVYSEETWVGSDITQRNIWSDVSKALKLFTKDYTYVGGLLTVMSLKDEITGKFLTTTLTYVDGVWSNTTKVIS